MANEQNLVDLKDLPKEEAKKIRSLGGKARARNMQRRKAIAEQMNLLLGLPLKSNKTKDQLKELGIPEEEMTNQMALVIKMYQTALSGGKNSVSAFNSIRDTIGEKPKEVLEHQGEINTNNPYEKLTDEELRKLINK